jgi:ankyrin repeat protein
MLAAQGNPEPAVLQVLLDRGAYVNRKNVTGMTPLLFAAQSTTNPLVVSVLLAAGADARALSGGGDTALGLASKNPRLRGTEVLRTLARASQ